MARYEDPEERGHAARRRLIGTAVFVGVAILMKLAAFHWLDIDEWLAEAKGGRVTGPPLADVGPAADRPSGGAPATILTVRALVVDEKRVFPQRSGRLDVAIPGGAVPATISPWPVSSAEPAGGPAEDPNVATLAIGAHRYPLRDNQPVEIEVEGNAVVFELVRPPQAEVALGDRVVRVPTAGHTYRIWSDHVGHHVSFGWRSSEIEVVALGTRGNMESLRRERAEQLVGAGYVRWNEPDLRFAGRPVPGTGLVHPDIARRKEIFVTRPPGERQGWIRIETTAPRRAREVAEPLRVISDSLRPDPAGS